uniref:Selenoprotein K n=1 Tax=Peronospora matthiolae TaxID=2874970 RepID=A0AAV1TAQ0_9STRA
MTYVTEGNVVNKRSSWRLSVIPDTFWGVVNLVGLFVTSLFSDVSSTTRSNTNIGSAPHHGPDNNRRGGPRRPMGRVNRQSTVNMPMGGGCCG